MGLSTVCKGWNRKKKNLLPQNGKNRQTASERTGRGEKKEWKKPTRHTQIDIQKSKDNRLKTDRVVWKKRRNKSTCTQSTGKEMNPPTRTHTRMEVKDVQMLNASGRSSCNVPKNNGNSMLPAQEGGCRQSEHFSHGSGKGKSQTGRPGNGRKRWI